MPARSARSTPLAAEACLVAAVVAAFLLFPDNLGLLTRILVTMVLVLSIDLVLGYAGIVTLGQSALFGAGAYAAGLFALHVDADPLAGLAAGALGGAALAFASGLLVLRRTGLTLLILTIAVAQIAQEIANQARSVTGGADGLSGIEVGPLLGRFAFDLAGNTSYWYAVAVVVAVFALLRVIVASPLGLSARGLRENPARMAAIGAPVYRRRLVLYTIGGGIAGVAGALSAQVTEIVSPGSFAFVVSAEAVLMLVLGGAGRLYGALLGPLVFMGLQSVASAANAYTWLSVIGVLILTVVFALPKGLLDLPVALRIVPTALRGLPVTLRGPRRRA